MDYIIKIINEWQDIIDNLIHRLPVSWSRVTKYLLSDIPLGSIKHLPFKVRIVTLIEVLLFIIYCIIIMKSIIKLLFYSKENKLNEKQQHIKITEKLLHTQEHIDKEVKPPMKKKSTHDKIINELYSQESTIRDNGEDDNYLSTLNLKNLTPKEYKKAKKEHAKLLKKKGGAKNKATSSNQDNERFSPQKTYREMDEPVKIENTPIITMDDSIANQEAKNIKEEIPDATLEQNKEMFSDTLDRFLQDEEIDPKQVSQESQDNDICEPNNSSIKPIDAQSEMPIDNIEPQDNTKNNQNDSNDLEEMLDFFRE